jgi:CHAT domain-containing protein
VWEKERYIALLLKPNGTIHAIPLGEAFTIDALVNEALKATIYNDLNHREKLGELSTKVLGPLQAHLSGVQELFISPDGELNRVPFAALPTPGAPQRFLSESYQLRILTTGRDLLRLQKPATPTAANTPGPSALVADPDYGPAPAPRTSSRSGTSSWPRLPDTLKEADALKGLLRVSQPITGKEATAARVQGLAHPRVLHIATHGFFEPDPGRSGGKDISVNPGMEGATTTRPQPSPLHALERTYLALAGANLPAANPADDGRLTAAEASAMDLEGTELVTLSACDTALGQIQTGEGVYGLQRALTVAGARSTLLSLWKVSSERTTVFMKEFYQRLKAGQPRADALRDTQAFFRNHPNPTYRDVYSWGAFQLTGDWRPVQGL